MESVYDCEFKELCKECHPKDEVAKKRETCTEKDCKRCAVYWAFRNGYDDLEE